MTRSYCDWNATAPALPAAAEAAARALLLGNPSSVHAEGRAARAAVEKARGEVAALLGVGASQVTFTSGGTEAAATVLVPQSENDVLFAGATEHACILAGSRYSKERIVTIPVDGNGRPSFAALEQAVAARGLAAGHVCVGVQIANNETGVLNPPEFFRAAREKGWFVLADAVQAAGKIDLTSYVPHVDALFISAHKVGGPKGVGALVVGSNACGGVRPMIVGGGQEKGMRGGTENVSGIVGLGAAATHAKAALPDMARVAAMRDAFEARLLTLAPDAVIFGKGVARLPNTSLFAIPGLSAQTALIAFDLDGVAVSSGSACASGKVGQSHVLAAMGIDPALGSCAIRVSFGDRSGAEDADKVLHSLERQLGRLQGRRPAA